MAGVNFTQSESESAYETSPASRRIDRWSRRALLSSALGLGAAAAISGRSAAQRGPIRHEATPEIDPDDAADHGLASMLDAIPLASAQGAVSAGQWFRYTSLLTQWEALGVAPPTSMSLDDIEFNVAIATQGMVLDAQVFSYVAVPEVVETLGFQPLTVHETLSIGQPPNMLHVFHGGMDLDALPAAWEAAGFEPVSINGDEVWSYGPDGEYDLEDAFSRVTLGGMNNVTILDSGHVIFARTLEQVETLLTARAEDETSLAEQQALAALVPTLPEDTMSLLAMDGTTILRTPEGLPSRDVIEAMEERFAESDDAVGPMPLLGMVLIGITGGPFGSYEDAGATGNEAAEDDGHMVVRFETAAPEQAAQAAEVVRYRWENWTTLQGNFPYTEFGTVARAETEGNVAVIDFAPGDRAVSSLTMVYTGDLQVFAS